MSHVHGSGVLLDGVWCPCSHAPIGKDVSKFAPRLPTDIGEQPADVPSPLAIRDHRVYPPYDPGITRQRRGSMSVARHPSARGRPDVEKAAAQVQRMPKLADGEHMIAGAEAPERGVHGLGARGSGDRSE